MDDIDLKLKNFRNNIKNNRKLLNLTQEDIAQKLGIISQSYQAYESGQSVPGLERFLKLCEIFDITPNDLLEIE